MTEPTISERLYYLDAKIMEADAQYPGAQQAIALQTASGNVHVILNDKAQDCNFEAETRYLEQMAQSGDTHVLYMLAMWRTGIDLASYHLRTSLVEMDQRNLDTLMILNGGMGRYYRPLGSTLSEKFLNEFYSRR